MASDTGVMDRSQINIPSKIFVIPDVRYLLYKNHSPVKSRMSIKIPGGKRNGVNIFFKINILWFFYT